MTACSWKVVYVRQHGPILFAVQLFDEFIRRDAARSSRIHHQKIVQRDAVASRIRLASSFGSGL